MSISLEKKPRLGSVIANDISTVYGIEVDTDSTHPVDHSLFSYIVPPLPENIEGDLLNLAYSIGHYPPDLIHRLNISAIKIAHRMVKKADAISPSIPVDGLMDNDSGRLYIVSLDDGSAFHHELMHRLLFNMNRRSYLKLTSQWKGINHRHQLKYTGFKLPLLTALTSRPYGFTSDYGQTDIEEDIPETVAKLFTDPDILSNPDKADPPLTEKIKLSLKLLDKLSNGVMSQEWRQSLWGNSFFNIYSFLENKQFYTTA